MGAAAGAAAGFAVAGFAGAVCVACGDARAAASGIAVSSTTLRAAIAATSGPALSE